ncbi:MAG: RHS repeat protein [Lentimicrobiaceae bacterium]|nr:RHS repeat protein [Lentimicrobiaceae bacterium]MDD4598972.1 RHS repeat protein [Lentimicrobiaceae bacterium]
MLLAVLSIKSVQLIFPSKINDLLCSLLFTQLSPIQSNSFVRIPYYPETGLLQTTICNNVQSFEYAYDNLGNMTDRYDHFHKTNSQSLHEEFGYDDRNQLTSVTLNGASPRIFEYDALGNIESNPDAGAFD